MKEAHSSSNKSCSVVAMAKLDVPMHMCHGARGEPGKATASEGVEESEPRRPWQLPIDIDRQGHVASTLGNDGGTNNAWTP